MASLPNTDELMIVSSTGYSYAKHWHTKHVLWDYGGCEKLSKCWQLVSLSQFKPFWDSLIKKKQSEDNLPIFFWITINDKYSSSYEETSLH